ncbi:MAG: hypothetical protein GXO25_05200 [Euryarchaeota archaeon]|nr:hypothetical protein [Euryarchaeota archaeon]
MGRGIYMGVGIGLLVPSVLLFAMDMYSLNSYILYALSALAFFGSIMAGKKLAMYVHDLHLAKERGYSLGPAMFIYMWLFMFVLFLILYTIAKVMMGYFVKLLFLPLGGAYLPLIYNPLALIALYLLFGGVYAKKENFLTVWGKTSEDMHNMAKSAPEKIANVPAKGAKTGMDMMNDGMKMMKKVKKN